MSCECFHCVDLREVHSTNQTREFLNSISGTVCPLCGVRAKEFYLVADSEEFEKRRNGTDIWNWGDEPTAGFARFGVQSDAPSRGSSAAADRLRGQLSNAANRRKKTMCQEITDFAQADIALKVGRKARDAGQLDRAKKAFEVCAGSGKPEGFQAAFHLGELAEVERNRSSAVRWYRQAAETPEVTLRAVASLHLGIACWETGQLDAAARAFQRCVDCGPNPVQAMATVRLGDVRYEQDDRAGAREAYEFAVGLQDRLGSPEAAVNLGALEQEDGHWDRAKDLWDYAHESGDAETSRVAAFNLGRFWEHCGKNRQARKFYELARYSEDPDIVARACAILNSVDRA